VSDTFDEKVQSIASLGDDVRRALYLFVASHDRAISRDEAAEGVGVTRSTVAFNLDRLVADGLLETEFRRVNGRQGPGAGRPAKLYRRADRELSVSLPERRYDLAADLMASAMRQSTETGAPVQLTLRHVAFAHGTSVGETALSNAGRRPSRAAVLRAACVALTDQGYEPRTNGREIVLANGPFHRLAAEHTELVCGMNHALLEGVAASLPRGVMRARLEPSRDQCCVRLDIEPARSRRS
jgi:predicted ArsR family transcriptional regulator